MRSVTDVQGPLTDNDCPFCQIIQGSARARIVLETADCLAFFPLNPAIVGHVLVVPRRHIVDIWSLDVTAAIALTKATLRVAHAIRAALNPDGLNIIQSNGAAATQTVDHVHVHAVPRWNNDRIKDFWPPDSPWSTPELDQVQSAIAEQM